MTKHAIRICRCGHEEFDHVNGVCRVCGEPCKFRPRGKRRGNADGIEGSDRRRLATQKLHADIAKAVSDFLKNVGEDVKVRVTPAAAPTPSKKTTFDSVDEIRATLPTLTKAHVEHSGEIKLGKGERAVLTVIAQHAKGVTRQQIRQITGYSRRTADQYLSNLRGLDFIVDGDFIQASDDGIKALGKGFRRLPTGDALYQHLLGELGRGEARILALLHDEWPGALEKSSIEIALKYTRRSRDQYLSNLRSRRLIEDVGKTGVRAADILFDKRRKR